MAHLKDKNLLYVWDDERRKLYVVPAGAEGEGDPPGTTPPTGGEGGDGGEGGSGGGDEPRTFTQEEVTRMMAREKSQGREAAERALSEELGVSLDDAKSIIKAARDAEEAAKSEAQREKEAAEAARREAEAEKAAAARERHDLKVERMLGIADEAKAARVRKMLTVEAGASDDDIQADIDSLKADFPELFTTGESGGGKRKPPSSSPPGTPPPPKPSEDAFSRGKERAAKYRRGGVSYEDATA